MRAELYKKEKEIYELKKEINELNLKISHEEIQKRKTDESLNHNNFVQQTESKKFNDNINVLTHDNWHLSNRLQRDSTALNDQIRLKDDLNNQVKYKDEELSI